MATRPGHKKTSTFLDQFKNVSDCTYSQDIVDGLRAIITDLEARLTLSSETINELMKELYEEKEMQRTLEKRILELEAIHKLCDEHGKHSCPDHNAI